ncbi:MFS transporter [Congregibacter sp.]|uniref:MFS transporter n=1 Tax=Congregibacter sp. TaxID=2744308 RepID=UPI003F6B9295
MEPETAVSATRRTGLFSHPGLLMAGAAAFAMSTLFSALKPVLVTRLLEETSWGAGMAGVVVAAPFLGIALSSLLFYIKPPRASIRRLALTFGTVLVLLELLSALLFEIQLLLLGLQFVAGFCVGALMAATSRLVAVSDAPDESFGFIDMSAVALMSVMVAGAGIAVATAGVMGGYGFAAIVAFVYAGIIACYRETPALLSHHDHALPPLQLSSRPLAVILMGMLFVTCSGLGFAFMFSLAARLGMGYEEAGSQIGVLLLLSALACQLGGWCSGRFGPRFPLLAAFVACAMGWWVVVHAQSPGVFMLGLVPAVFALQFNFPILLALAGSLDEHGRWAGIAAPLITSGFAWAAIVAGQVVELMGLEALASATALGMVLCAVLLWPATARRDAAIPLAAPE